jgi:hypothetical protein
VNHLRRLHSFELDRINSLWIISNCEFDGEPRRDDHAWIDMMIPEASPELIRPLLRRHSTEPESLLMRPASTIKTFNPFHGIAHPSIIRIRQQPFDGRTAIRIDFSRLVAAFVWAPMTSAMICMRSAEPRVQPVSRPCPRRLPAADHPTHLEHMTWFGGSTFHLVLAAFATLPFRDSRHFSSQSQSSSLSNPK